MAISVQSTPPFVALTGNPVFFKLRTDNNIEIPGVPHTSLLNFTSVAQEGDTLIVAWGSYSLDFLFTASPDGSGLQLPVTPANLQDWITEITRLFNLNYYLSRDFIITTNLNDIQFVSRFNGSGYEITFTWDWTGSEPSVFASEGTDEVARTFFKIGLQVLILEGSDFSIIGEDLLPVDSNKDALFNIRHYFSDHLESEFKFPDASDQLIILRENMCREYKIRYYERFGSNLTPQILTESDSFFVLKAGISHLQEAIYNRQGSSLWEKITYNDYFLTWQPKSKFIDRWQTEKLYYLVQDTKTSLDLVIEVNYNDETAQATITKESIADPQVKGVYEIALTLNTLQLPGYDQDIIDYFRVWMEDGDNNRIFSSCQ